MLQAISLLSEVLAENVAERKRLDAAAVREFVRSLEQGEVTLAFQPVFALCNAQKTLGRHLYSEVLTRLGHTDGGQPCGKVIQALERLDRIAWYDMLVLATVFDLLKAHPYVSLGCNVSALTLRMTKAWDMVFARLNEAPDVAKRLTLEITETAVLPDMGQALCITRMLQVLGCKIAIDDLGSGRTSLAFVRDCRPDVIKIDRSVLMLGSGDSSIPQSAGLLPALVRLSTHLSPCVVMEGIDSDELLLRALDAGVTAVQGNLLEAPNLQPSWLLAPVPLDVRLEDRGAL